MKRLNVSPLTSVTVILSAALTGIGGCCQKVAAQSTLTSAEKARIEQQAKSLERSHIRAGQQAAKSTASEAQKKMQAVDKQHQADRDYVRKKTDEWSYVIGPDAAKQAGAASEKALDEQSAAEKNKIAKQAARKEEMQKAVAAKRAAGVNASVEGLKSQVSKDGKFGLQPKGSNLHVRQYGK
jgi:hypothetical protein